MRILVLLLLTVAPASLGAGEQLIDDFEGPTLLTTDVPPGHWSGLDPYAGVTLTISGAARHRGDGGLRLLDSSGNAGAGNMTSVYSPPLVLPATASLRFWMRVTATNEQGSSIVGQLLSGSAAVCDVMAEFSSNRLSLAGEDQFATYGVTPSSIALDAGTTLLVECAVVGMGTTSGRRSLYVNGVLAAEQAGLDLTGLSVTEADFGEPYSDDRSFVGLLDFDDVRVADRLQASRLWIDAGAPVVSQGECREVGFGLVAADGTASSLPYTSLVTATLGLGRAYSDSLCAAPTTDLLLDAGQPGGTFFLQPGVVGPLAVTITHPDLVSAGLVLDVVATDAGPDGGASSDAGDTDAGAADAGAADAGAADAGAADASVADAGVADGGVADAGMADAGASDAGSDAGAPDAGLPTSHPFAVGCGCASHGTSPLVALGLLAAIGRLRRRDRGPRRAQK